MFSWWRSQSWEGRAGLIGRGLAIAWLFIIPYSRQGACNRHPPHDGGEKVVDPGLAATALSEGGSPLSEREREVLLAAGGGAGLADVARCLHLSEGTVRNHLSVAIQKLHARNRVEAARIAEAKGWL